MPEPVKRTQTERRSSSERALLQAAIELIAAEGVGAVTFEAVGRIGGFSRGLAGLRFGSKAGLIDAVLRHLHEEQEAVVAHHGLDALPGLDAVLAYAEISLRSMADRPEGRAYFRLLSWSIAEVHPSRDAFAAMHGAVAARIERWIVKGQGEGVIARAIDPGPTAIAIGAQLLGLSTQSLIDADAAGEALRAASIAGIRASLKRN